MAVIIRNWMIGDTTIDDELQLLRSKKQGLCALVDDLNIQLEADEMQPGKKRKRVVGNWLKNVEELLTEVKYFEQDVERGLFSSTKKLKREILSLIREMEDLMEQGKFSGGLTLDDHACSSVPLVTTNLKGKVFEENMKMILSWLVNEDLCRIGVYGLGGVGKTTLAKHIHNKLLEGAETSMHIYWVTVSQENTIATLQNKIAKAAKVEHILLQDDDDTKRAANLYAALKKRKKVVLFLDDMWKNFDVEKVGIPVGKDECRLIITTRSLDVCRRMECKHRVKIEPLTEDESWELFMEKCGDSDDLSLEVRDVAKLVAKKCAGLPLGIITIARSMMGVTDIHEWRSTLEELSNFMRRHYDMENDVYPILELSYARLNDSLLQKCFLNCALYPEDFRFTDSELVDFWLADGLLEEIDSQEKQLDKGYTILNRLINASLLELANSKGTYLKMHDLIRDMAIKIGRETHHFMVRSGLGLTRIPDDREWTEDLTKVSLMQNKISEIEPNVSPMCPSLTTLLLSNSPLKYILDMFFLHMKCLRFLIITRAPMEKLPNSISELENLSTLIVFDCSELIYVPCLKKLVKLRELNLSFNDSLEVLPEGIDMLPNLRVLELSCYHLAKLCVPFRSLITRFSHIENLVAGYGIKEIESKLLMELQFLRKLECWISNGSDFNSYVKSPHFQQLKCYIFYISPVHSTPFFSLIAKTFNRSVVLYNYGNQSSKTEPLVLPDNIQFLQLIEADLSIRCLLDAVQSIHGLTSLMKVWIGYCKHLEYIWSYASSLTEPRSLWELNLSELSNFRGLTRPGIPPSAALYNLKKLSMEYCSKIKTLFTPRLLNQLQNLEVLEVQVCTELEEILTLSDFHEDTRGEDFKEEVPSDAGELNISTIYLPKLRELLLIFLPNLVSICSKGLLGCTNIEVITIIECPLLKKLPLFFPLLNNGHPACAAVSLKRMIVQKQWWEEVVEWDHPDYALLLEPVIEFQRVG